MPDTSCPQTLSSSIKLPTVSRGHADHCVSSGVKTGQKTQGLTFCLSAPTCLQQKMPSCSDDEQQQGMEPSSLISRHLRLRQPLQLTDTHTTHGHGRCGGPAEDTPIAVTNPPRLVLLRKSEMCEEDFVTVTVTGVVTMRPISSTQDKGACFVKRDYIVEDRQCAATFMNLLTQTYVAVSQQSQVQLCKLAGDPPSCPHPCLFLVEDTGTTKLLPTETPGRYLGYRGSVLEVTDRISSFNMLPASLVTQPADHRDHPVGTWGLKAATSMVDSSTEDFAMPATATSTGGQWPTFTLQPPLPPAAARQRQHCE